MPEDRCWCGHLRRWHNFASVCLWCARMEARHGFNFSPHHSFSTEIPESVREKIPRVLE